MIHSKSTDLTDMFIGQKFICKFSYFYYFIADILPILIVTALVIFRVETNYIIGSLYVAGPLVLWMGVTRYWFSPYPLASLVNSAVRYRGKAIWVDGETLHFFDKIAPVLEVASIEKRGSYLYGNFILTMKNGVKEGHPIIFVKSIE